MKLHHYLWAVAAACMLLPGCSNEDLSDHAAAPVFIPGNSEVFHLCRVMYLDKEPLFIDSSWIPLSRYPDFDEIYVEGSSTYQLFQERFDTRVVSDKKTIDIFAATRPQAKWLKCELGEPLFRISKIAFDQNDKPVHVSELLCRANRITLTIDNKRH